MQSRIGHSLDEHQSVSIIGIKYLELHFFFFLITMSDNNDNMWIPKCWGLSNMLRRIYTNNRKNYLTSRRIPTTFTYPHCEATCKEDSPQLLMTSTDSGSKSVRSLIGRIFIVYNRLNIFHDIQFYDLYENVCPCPEEILWYKSCFFKSRATIVTYVSLFVFISSSILTFS